MKVNHCIYQTMERELGRSKRRHGQVSWGSSPSVQGPGRWQRQGADWAKIHFQPRGYKPARALFLFVSLGAVSCVELDCKSHVDKTWGQLYQCVVQLQQKQHLLSDQSSTPTKAPKLPSLRDTSKNTQFSLIPVFDILFKPQLRSISFQKLGVNIQGDAFC